MLPVANILKSDTRGYQPYATDKRLSATRCSPTQYQLWEVLRPALLTLRLILRIPLRIVTDKDLLYFSAAVGTIIRLQQLPQFILSW